MCVYIYIYWVLPKSIDHPRPSSGPCLVPHCPAADRRTHAPWRNVTRKPMEKSGIFPKNPRCRSIKATNTHVKYGFKTYFIVSTGLCLQSINMYIYIYTFICLFMDWLDLVAIACTCRGTVSSSEAANKKKAKKLMLLHDFFQATLLSSNVSFSHSNPGKSSIFIEVLNGQKLGTKWRDCQLARYLLKPEANQQKPLDLTSKNELMWHTTW